MKHATFAVRLGTRPAFTLTYSAHLDHVAPHVHVLLVLCTHTHAVLAGVACQGLGHLVDRLWGGAVQECTVWEEAEVAEVCD